MKTSLKLSLLAAAILAFPTLGHGQSVKLDGIFTGADQYMTSESVKWYNGHSGEYGTAATAKYSTMIRYGVATAAGDLSGTKYFYVFVDVPLYAKNMVWGAGMTAEEVGQYGKRLDFNGATGSEKFMFNDSTGKDLLTVDYAANLAGKDPGNALGLIAFKDSADYLFANGLADKTSSANHDVTMSIEMQFAVNADNNKKVIELARNGLDVHLSPSRGLMPDTVPEPGSALLVGLSGALLAIRRRRR